MITPICASTTSGSTPSAAKTAASRMPAEVMTEPVVDKLVKIAWRVPSVVAASRVRVTRKIV